MPHMPRILFLAVALAAVACSDSRVGTSGRAEELTAPIDNIRALGAPEPQVAIGTTISTNCFGPDAVHSARYRSTTHSSAFLHVLRFAAYCAAWCYQARECLRFLKRYARCSHGASPSSIEVRHPACDIAISGRVDA